MLIEIKEKANKQISDAEAAAEIFRSILSAASEVDRDKEHFWVIGLNAKNVILYVELVSIGTLENSIVSPRETFRMAIMKAAAQIIVGHNHPSGSLEMSSEDKEITRRLRQAGEILGIKLRDHIIIGNNNSGCFSFHRKGLLEEDSRKVTESAQNAKEDILEQIDMQRTEIFLDVLTLKALADLSLEAAYTADETKKETDWVSIITLFNMALDSLENKVTKLEQLISDYRKKA